MAEKKSTAAERAQQALVDYALAQQADPHALDRPAGFTGYTEDATHGPVAHGYATHGDECGRHTA